MSKVHACLPVLLAFAALGVAHAQQPPDYRLYAGDKIEASVWKEPDLQRTVIVRPDGKFSFPLVGEVVAAGRSVTEIQADIAARLKKYIPDPVITVSVTEVDGNRIYVIGQVNKPGAYIMNPRLNVLQALSMAAGTTAYAALNDIIIVRGSGAGQKTLRFRYTDMSKGKDVEQNILLESGDVVVVP
jgi:polysaccharide export outer membrane protein